MANNFCTVTELSGDSPESTMLAWRAQLQKFPGALAIGWHLNQDWDKKAGEIALWTIFCLRDRDHPPSLAIGRSRDADAEKKLLRSLDSPEALSQWLRHSRIPEFSVGDTPQLQPVSIPKPWGEEIWFSGIEQRGVSKVQQDGLSIPLPWLTHSLPMHWCAADNGTIPLLVKILSPFPIPVFGDLYFELHELKREVYVVTGVDKKCWPDGRGAIRLGFAPEVLDRYPDPQQFRADFLTAVLSYEKVRRQIDGLLDLRAAAAMTPAAVQRQIDDTIPEILRHSEIELRQTMESFTQLQPLAVGDIVQIPLRVPHALQHGVRVVEFQTPVYERKIISFAQKVLTQEHWDTREAVAKMKLTLPAPPETILLQARQNGVRHQRIAGFEDFSAEHLYIPRGTKFNLPAADICRIAIGITGSLKLGNDDSSIELGAEQSCLLAAGTAEISIRNDSAQAGRLLLAVPTRELDRSQY